MPSSDAMSFLCLFRHKQVKQASVVSLTPCLTHWRMQHVSMSLK